LAEELTSSSSEEKEHTQAKKKGEGQETTGKTSKTKLKGTQGKSQAAKTGGDKTTPTPREKRLQSRVERTENVQGSEGTSKAATTKLKGKAPAAKQATTVLSIPTGSIKMASTGSQKSATGLSTGSHEKGKQKEKSAEILAREAAAVLATLGTSPNPKEK